MIDYTKKTGNPHVSRKYYDEVILTCNGVSAQQDCTNGKFGAEADANNTAFKIYVLSDITHMDFDPNLFYVECERSLNGEIVYLWLTLAKGVTTLGYKATKIAKTEPLPATG